MVEAIDLFLKIGLNKRTAENTIANNKVTNNLISVINDAGVIDGCDRSTGNLLYTVATKFPANALMHRPKLLEYIVSSKIKTPNQVEAVVAFITITGSEDLDISKFEDACGVGVEVSLEDIESTVMKYLRRKRVQSWSNATEQMLVNNASRLHVTNNSV